MSTTISCDKCGKAERVTKILNISSRIETNFLLGLSGPFQYDICESCARNIIYGMRT